MGLAAGRLEEEVLAKEPQSLGEHRHRRLHTSVQWQPVARRTCRMPKAGNAWLFNGAFAGDIEAAKKQATAVGGAHFTKYSSWLQVVGNDSHVEATSDPTAVLFSQASAAWTPLGASRYNVDRGGVLRSHPHDETPSGIISNVPAMAVSFRFTDDNTPRNLGLAIGTSGHANSHFTLISDTDRCIYAGNALYGWDVRSCGSSCEGDFLTIEHTGSEVVFWKNDEVMHALGFSLTPGEQFYAYASIVQAGGEMRELAYVPSPVKPSLSFRMLRFTPTRLRSATATAVQISELKFRRQGPPGSIIDTRHVVASNPGGHNPASQGPEMAIDGKQETKWLDLNKGALVIEFPLSAYEDTIVDEFCFTTGDDMEDRDPVQWRLEGSMTGAEWTPLHVQSHFYDTPRGRRVQTAWFPFNTFDVGDIVGECPAACAATAPLEPPPCLVTMDAFDAQLKGVTCTNWQDFCSAAAPLPDLAGPGQPGSRLLSILTLLAAFLLNLLIWFLLTMLGTHHSLVIGLLATLAYGFTLQAVLARGLEPAAQPGVSSAFRAAAWPWATRRKGLKEE